MAATAHVDTFARDHLPPRAAWPDLPDGGLSYPDTLNAADELLAGGAAGAPCVRGDGFVYVNDRKIVESYIYEGQPTQVASGDRHWMIPTGDLFVLGDHRQLSADSRIFGPIGKASVIGRAWLRYWPLGAFGVMPTPIYQNLAASP